LLIAGAGFAAESSSGEVYNIDVLGLLISVALLIDKVLPDFDALIY
jgi:hypothetical protein